MKQGDMKSLEEAVRNYNETTGENVTVEEIFKLREFKQNRTTEVIQTATETELKQLKFKVNNIITDFIDYYAPKGRKLKAVFHFIKEDKNDTYGEKAVFGDMIEIVLNIDTGVGSIEDE